MERKSWAGWALGINLALLFGLGLWFRVTSLGAMPEVIGDEYWESIQLCRSMAGKAVKLVTPSGNPLNPFLAWFYVLLHLVHAPAPWLVRVPSVVCGILTVALTYEVTRRLFDRTTALMAAGLMAVLPIAVIFSRIGYPASMTPLVSLAAFSCAFHGRRLAALLSFLASFVVQPTNVFLLPTLVAVYLARELTRSPRDPARLRRRLLEVAAVAVALVAAAGLLTLRRRYVQNVYSAWKLGDYQPWQFLKFYGRLMLGEILLGIRRRGLALEDALFWGIVGPVVAVGSWRMMRAREWDRLAVVVGLALGAGGLFAVAGANAIRPEMPRYGVFLIVPSVFAFALLLRSLLAKGSASRLVRVGQYGSIVLLGWLLLWATKRNWFDACSRGADESPWTFRTELPDPNERVLALVRRDARATLPAPGAPSPGFDRGRPPQPLIIAENWWTYRPLQYLTLARGDVKIVAYDQMGTSLDQHATLLRARLERGAYAVGFSGGPVEKLVSQWYPAERLQRWDIPHNGGNYFYNGSRTLAVFRLKPVADVPAMARSRAIDSLTRH